MKLNDVLQKDRDERLVELYPGKHYLKPAPMVHCMDGYTISIQCSEHSYCSPRKNIKNVSEYTEFELGFPNELDPLIEEYAQESETIDTVFAYVPRSVVEALLEKHGGIKPV